MLFTQGFGSHVIFATVSLNGIRTQMPTASERFARSLVQQAPDFDVRLDARMIEQLVRYYELLMKWNPRLHLVAPCSAEEFAGRHVLESLFALRYLKQDAAIVDVGSGGGLPGIPCLIARPDLQVTLIESSTKKAVFLREALRQLPSKARVLAERFEEVPPPQADYLMCRALERLGQKLPALLRWAPPSSTLLLFAGEALRRQLEAGDLDVSAFLVPTSKQRFLLVVKREN
jgi:16S rRNA (guanine527-N7)-methyltransferase